MTVGALSSIRQNGASIFPHAVSRSLPHNASDSFRTTRASSRRESDTDLIALLRSALAGHHTDKWGVSDLVGGAGDAFGAG